MAGGGRAWVDPPPGRPEADLRPVPGRTGIVGEFQEGRVGRWARTDPENNSGPGNPVFTRPSNQGDPADRPGPVQAATVKIVRTAAATPTRSIVVIRDIAR